VVSKRIAFRINSTIEQRSYDLTLILISIVQLVVWRIVSCVKQMQIFP